MNKLLITAPHSFCVNRQERDCDRKALYASNTLYGQAIARNIPALLFQSHTLRSQHDLNRSPSRSIDFRVSLRQYMHAGSILIDVHSYPSDGFGLPDTMCTILGQDEEDIYLTHYLATRSVSVKFLYGSEVNDIVAESVQNGMKAYLIEFFENAPEPVIDDICSKILDWIVLNYKIKSV